MKWSVRNRVQMPVCCFVVHGIARDPSSTFKQTVLLSNFCFVSLVINVPSFPPLPPPFCFPPLRPFLIYSDFSRFRRVSLRIVKTCLVFLFSGVIDLWATLVLSHITFFLINSQTRRFLRHLRISCGRSRHAAECLWCRLLLPSSCCHPVLHLSEAQVKAKDCILRRTGLPQRIFSKVRVAVSVFFFHSEVWQNYYSSFENVHDGSH